MVYNWDDKEAECYRLYVEEKKSLDEVIAHFEARGFTPSKRAFQTQFKRWDFPSKQNPAHKNPALVARLQQLWEQNYTQKEMVDTLQDEGYQINDRELIRLRLRLKLLLRESVPRPRRRQSDDGGTQEVPKRKKAKSLPGKGLINQLGNAILAESSGSSQSSEDEEATYITIGVENAEDIRSVQPAPKSPSLDPEDSLRRQLRQEQLQRESDEKWRTRKRRRRTRGWAGLPADTPGEPPRFPSETTIDEAKAYLGLDNSMYRRVRERFQEICEAEGVIKKTAAGPERWTHLVQRLIQEDAHLVSVFQHEPEVFKPNNDALFRPKEQRALSIDVICMDVTKRLRTMETRMTLADAKNALGLNPEQTRQVRAAYIAKLKTAHFSNKYEAGEEHWAQLKTTWINESDHLTRALAQGDADPGHDQGEREVVVEVSDDEELAAYLATVHTTPLLPRPNSASLFASTTGYKCIEYTSSRPTVYYDIDRVLELLQHYCPEVLQDLSGLDSLQTFGGTVVGAATPEPIAALEVGRPWGGAIQAEDGETPKLCVWDKGGYHSSAPDLTPYTYRRPSAEASSERGLIDANGFDAIGIFAEFRECSNPRRNPRLDDAYVVALFQFIMMLRNNRRYYYYGDRHQDDPKEHLKDLVGALRRLDAERRAELEAKKLHIRRLMQENRRSREDSVFKGDANEQSKKFDLVELASARRDENGERSPRRAEGAGRDLIFDDSEDHEYVPDSEDSSSDEDCDSEEDHNKEDDNSDDHHMGFGDP
ncbi:hypothetical protein E8E11_005202 [Didymella keratinophila]|nr:hypothetical protein E8E11_005202 [Didymella keratinophila]